MLNPCVTVKFGRISGVTKDIRYPRISNVFDRNISIRFIGSFFIKLVEYRPSLYLTQLLTYYFRYIVNVNYMLDRTV